jgi:hypothetical protein
MHVLCVVDAWYATDAATAAGLGMEEDEFNMIDVKYKTR